MELKHAQPNHHRDTDTNTALQYGAGRQEEEQELGKELYVPTTMHVLTFIHL